MNRDGSDGDHAEIKEPTDGVTMWLVVGIVLVFGVVVVVAVVLVCWWYRNKVLRRSDDGSKGAARSSAPPVDGSGRLLHGTLGNPLDVEDLGEALIYRPGKSPPQHPYENVLDSTVLLQRGTMEPHVNARRPYPPVANEARGLLHKAPGAPVDVEDVGAGTANSTTAAALSAAFVDSDLPKYENLKQVPEWLQVFTASKWWRKKRHKCPQVPTHVISVEGTPGQAALIPPVRRSGYGQGASSSLRLHTEKDYQLHSDETAASTTGWHSDPACIDRPVATSTPTPSDGESPDYGPIVRATSQAPVRAPIKPKQDRESVPRWHWDLVAGAAEVENMYAEVSAVPTGLVFPIRRDHFPPTSVSAASTQTTNYNETPVILRARPREWNSQAAWRDTFGELSKAAGANIPDGPGTRQEESADGVPHTSTLTKDKHGAKRKPPKPLPRKSLILAASGPTDASTQTD